MLYHLLYPLHEHISGFNVFRYITFRAGAAAVFAFLICILVAPFIIKLMLSSGVVDEIRSDGPQSHKVKAGTPTMGGLIILPAIILSTLLFARLDTPHVWVVVVATAWMGVVGFIDDYLKKNKDKKGLVPRYKLLGQVTLGLLIGLVLMIYPESFSGQFAEHRTLSTLPFFKDRFLDFAPWGLTFLYVTMSILVLTGTSNSVNLTDGLDGLAIGVVGIIATGLAILAYISGNAIFSDYLNIIYLPGSGELVVYCTSILGASLGFLWYNAPPAKIYMGDTGSLALGAGIAAVSILIKKELFLLMLGGILVAESLSVISQRYYFKYTRKRTGTGKRLFRMAPIHHHFELMGWKETTIVVRFWIIGLLLLFLTLTSLKVR